MTAPRFGLILGFPRSGGTLLRRILDQHPEVSCPPEPWLTTACARFLADTPSEGIPIGVRTGLGFMGITEDEVTAALRELLFRFHGQMAGGKPVWVEKSGFDVFHLAALSDLLAGHAKFIGMLRHPLDTIASNLDLLSRMGRPMPEMLPWLARFPAPVEALAEAWAERTTALLDFVAGRQDAVIYRFEDLLATPEAIMAQITGLLGVAPLDLKAIGAAVTAPSRPGLGDWKAHGAAGLSPAPVGRWQTAISRRTAGGLMARLAPVMARAGHEALPVPRMPTRADAIKQFGAAGGAARRQSGGPQAVRAGWQAFARTVAARRDHPALVMGDLVVSFGELGQMARHLAGGLQARGVGPGDRVVLHLGNGPAAAALPAALWAIGAVPVLAPSELRAETLAGIAARVAARGWSATRWRPVVQHRSGGPRGWRVRRCRGTGRAG